MVKLILLGSGDKIVFEDVITLVDLAVLVSDSAPAKPGCQHTLKHAQCLPTSVLIKPDAHILSTNHPHLLYRRRPRVSCSENNPFDFSVHQVNEAIRVVIHEIYIEPTSAAAYVNSEEGVGSVDNVTSLSRSIVEPSTGD